MLSLTLTFATLASWYGLPYHGRRTASGEVYNMNSMTAAHRSLPFGTRLRVCNKRTSKCTTVRINDRGPFIAGRELDLSRAAARAIGLDSEGVGRVTITPIK
jgi:rare lipoprotein A